MRIILKEKNKYILRFDTEDEVLSLLSGFCVKHKINAGFFSAFGACKEVELAYYDLDKKEYQSVNTSQRMEIVSLTGNVAKMDDDIIIHSHGVFADSGMKTKGGHVKKLVVSATCEMFFYAFEEGMKREFDKNTGLNLLL